jgi:integrase
MKFLSILLAKEVDLAIIKRKRKLGIKYQVKIRGSDGHWITDTYDNLREAKLREAEVNSSKLTGGVISAQSRNLSVGEYFSIWATNTKSEVSAGWRRTQNQMFESYIAPILEKICFKVLSPSHIQKVMKVTADQGRSPQTRLHVFNFMRKMFGDAVEIYELLHRNPVLKKFKPKLIKRERPFLSIDEIITLLSWIRGKPFEVAVWLGVYLGLRVGEIQALIWTNIDLKKGIIHVRATYVRREKSFRDYPKGKKWHSHSIPPELLDILRTESEKSAGRFVVTSPRRDFMSYDGYLAALKRYCKEAQVPEIATHGLRHSTSGIYRAHGATKDDLRQLFAHSSHRVTDGYIHENDSNLDKVAKVIRLFPIENLECSPNVPQSHKKG